MVFIILTETYSCIYDTRRKTNGGLKLKKKKLTKRKKKTKERHEKRRNSK